MGVPISRNTKILGLFTSAHMPYHIDKSSKEPSLSEMTEVAIKVLSQNPKGFFLMVEGGKLDVACHANDPVATIYNTAELDNAVQKAMDFRKEDSNTLIFVGGDHETGGMGLGIGLDYFIKPEVIKGASKTYEWAGKTYSKKKGDPVAIMSQATGITDFTPEEIEAIKMAAEQVLAKKRFANTYNRNWLAHIYADIMSKRSHIGWTTWAHTANPVMATAIGPGSYKLGGYYDNVVPAMVLSDMWGVRLKSWNVQ
jgi:alkaline phosphatase